MNKLCYKTLKKQGYQGYLLENAPERVLQFGEGNFLRAFADYFIDIMNEKAGFNSKVVLCQPIASGLADSINDQEGLYTLYLRGFEHGQMVVDKRLISCISRCLNPYQDFDALLQCALNPDLRFIICNTTEAGIVYDPACQLTDKPADSYPGKLTQFLYHRFKHYGSQTKKGFVILSCELIDDNGRELERCVLKYIKLWNLGDDFLNWIQSENFFCSTLVDRIVTGYPKAEADSLWKELGFTDKLIDTGEIFASWVIEGPEHLKMELPFEKAGLPVLITNDHKPYKQRKVRILNGAHTSIALGAYLAGREIVRDCMEDDVIHDFMNHAIYKEIIPTLCLPEEDLKTFAASVTGRFKNPFIDHSLLAISLNSTSKWKARVLPSLKQYEEQMNRLPACLTASFAFYLTFYQGQFFKNGVLTGMRLSGDEYQIKDDTEILQFFYNHRDDNTETYVRAVCKNQALWGEDLTLIPQFVQTVVKYVTDIRQKGVYFVMKECIT